MRLALAGGGTGGHVVPGLHLLEHLRARDAVPEDVLWFSAGRAVEERVLAGLTDRVGVLALERVILALEPATSGAPSWMRLVARTAPETARARRALARHGSEVLLALGGYTALPAVLAARFLGVPVVLLEINSVPGKATRTLAGLAERVVHAWPVPRAARAPRHACFGPPLAPAFLRPEPAEAESASARVRLGFDAGRPLLLALGGSQGAAALNRFVAAHAAALVAAGVQVLHQAGPGRLAEAAAAQPGYRAVEYLDDVAGALDAATLVLCRGGASTLAEVAARARPALVVPYPHHADRHQEANALRLGAGVRIVPEERLDAALVATLARLAGPEGTRERDAMSRALASALPRDGVARLADELLLVASRFRTTC
jgi:UDP-N-acetylglucosamine--N-acetylmuramyl-(pentapeptide) pyrophosphoryl-undecaprenol N-acetylglucosamine transferase